MQIRGPGGFDLGQTALVLAGLNRVKDNFVA